MTVSFFVLGTPKPGGSKKAIHHKTTGRIIVMDDGGKATKDWRKAVATEALRHFKQPLHGPLSVRCCLRLPRPKAHYKSDGVTLRDWAVNMQPTTRPDATKLWRSTEDAMTGIVWNDDAQIVYQVVYKVYSVTPGANITVAVMEREGISEVKGEQVIDEVINSI